MNRFRARGLFADERCSQAILDILFTTDVGRGVGLERVEEEVQSEVSEAELQERELGKSRRGWRQTSGWGAAGGDCTIFSIFGRPGRRARGATTSHLRTDRGRGGQWPGLRVKSTPP